MSKGDEEAAAKLGKKAIDENSRSLPPEQGKYILSASQAAQEALYRENDEHSIFTSFLLEGLKGSALDDKGNVTLRSLAKFIFRKMSEPGYERLKQRPVMRTEESGDVILASYPELKPKVKDAISTTTSEKQENQSAQKRLRKYRFLRQKRFRLLLSIAVTAVIIVTALGLAKMQQHSLITQPSYKYVLFNKGDELLNEGNYTQAIPYLDKALALDPKFEDALYDKGATLVILRNYTEALPYIDKALAIDPVDKYSLNVKGWALAGLGNYTQALSYLNKALAIDPNFESALDNKGSALASLGNYTQAIPYFDKALTIDPKDDTALDSKGWTLASLGNYTQAIPYFDKALTIDPKFEDALLDKGEALVRLGNYTQALPYLDKVLAIDPNNTLATNLTTQAQAALQNALKLHAH